MSRHENKQRPANITYMQAGVSCFVGQESGKNPCLRIAAKRYRTF
jgi:hypothetical protein